MLNKFLVLLLTIPMWAGAQITVSTQNAAYPLISALDSIKIKEISAAGILFEEKEKRLRDYLLPLCAENDALACYLLAISYDKFPSGNGTKADAEIAARYYQQAADGKLADACYFMYQMYRYNFMNMPVNEKLSLHYLREACKYGSRAIQAQCYRELAGIYYPRKENKYQSDMKSIKASKDSTKYYLTESLKIEPDDTWTLDFIGGIFEDEKNYQKAFSYYMKSRNENSQLRVANWLAKGDKIKKNIPLAIEIVKKVLATLVRENGFTPQTINNYMGSINPAVLLNIFHTCYKIISKEEVGEWYSNAISCDDFPGMAVE